MAKSDAAGARVGGDFWIATASEQGRLAVVIGDACGHGPQGAQQVRRFLPVVRELARAGGGPRWLLCELNRRVQRQIAVDRFVTAAALEFDMGSRRLAVANAGHVPLLLRRADGEVLVIGRPSGPPLGMEPGSDYGEEHYDFYRNDVLVTMTDGVLEAVETDLMGMRTLRQLVARAGQGSRAVQRAVLQRLEGSLAGSDDRTLVSLERRSSVTPVHPRYQQVA